MEQRRKGFTFYRSYYESAIVLPDKQRLSIYDAIVKYSFVGDITLSDTDDAIVKAIFLLIKPTLDNSLKKSEAGAKGGNKSHKSDAGDDAIKHEASSNQTVSRPQAGGKQDIIKQETGIEHNASKTKANAKQEDINNTSRRTHSAEGYGVDLIQQRFDGFWKVYPRKVGKGAAEKVWKRIKPDVELYTIILDAIAKQNKSSQWQRDNGQYIPNPSTWLNEKRWCDEPQKNVGKFDNKARNIGGFSQREYSDEDFERLETNLFGGDYDNDKQQNRL